MATASSTTAAVKVVALGGLGEIGLNLMVLECRGQALIVDAGVMFPEQRGLAGNCMLVPQLAYLERNRMDLLGVVLTHAHEDHIGALPHLLRRFRVPVFGSEVTLAFARRRLHEASLIDGAELRAIAPRRPFELGPFVVEPIRVTHSTPDSLALAVRTPAGL